MYICYDDKEVTKYKDETLAKAAIKETPSLKLYIAYEQFEAIVAQLNIIETQRQELLKLCATHADQVTKMSKIETSLKNEIKEAKDKNK